MLSLNVSKLEKLTAAVCSLSMERHLAELNALLDFGSVISVPDGGDCYYIFNKEIFQSGSIPKYENVEGSEKR